MCHRVCVWTDNFGTAFVILVSAHSWSIPQNEWCNVKYIKAVAPHPQQTPPLRAQPLDGEPLQLSCRRKTRDTTKIQLEFSDYNKTLCVVVSFGVVVGSEIATLRLCGGNAVGRYIALMIIALTSTFTMSTADSFFLKLSSFNFIWIQTSQLICFLSEWRILEWTKKAAATSLFHLGLHLPAMQLAVPASFSYLAPLTFTLVW